MPDKYDPRNVYFFYRAHFKNGMMGKFLPQAVLKALSSIYVNLAGQDNFLVLPYLELCITPACTLRCKHCANFMPLYKKPKHYTIDSIFPPLSAVMQAVDGIMWFRILGGEPLLHPEILKIISYCASFKKIQRIDLVTNGTIIPERHIVESMRKNNIGVYISNYGHHSKKREELVHLLKDNKITYQTDGQYEWEEMGTGAHHEYSPDEVKKVFATCKEICKTLLQDELHICPRSAHGTRLGLVRTRQNDYIKVLELDRKALRTSIRSLYNMDYIEACYSCVESSKRKKIPAGEQMHQDKLPNYPRR